MSHNTEIENPIYTGADQNVELELIDSAGDPYDFSAASKLVVIVYYKDKSVLSQFSMNVDAAYKVLDMTNAATGRLAFKLETDDTATAQEGKVYAEVHAQFADGDWEDGQFNLIGQGIYIGEVIESISGNTVLP